MREVVPLLFLLGLISWAAGLLLIAIGHTDLIEFGRSRGFGIVTNLVGFSMTIGGLIWAALLSRRHLVSMLIGLFVWASCFLFLGFWPYVAGSFGSPSPEHIRSKASASGHSSEWIERALGGPAVSAATPYMVDVYRWVLLSQVRSPSGSRSTHPRIARMLMREVSQAEPETPAPDPPSAGE